MSNYHPSANKQLLAKTCLGINAVVQHEYFHQIATTYSVAV
ncbi:hypothetical protein [Colwellia sp. BRX10-3]|nr:hypothetical protein [Colwellia sp. BRX10-3]